MESLEKPLKVVLLELGNRPNLYAKIMEAVQLYKSGRVNKVFLHHPDSHRRPELLFAVYGTCRENGVTQDDLIVDQPNLSEYVRESKEGIDRLVVITSWVEYVSAWYRFKRFPGWVWNPIRFHIAGFL